MKRLTREWVRKAEEDYRAALHASRIRRSPLYDVICFHAQQSVEKYLKGYLQEHAISFGKTHDLTELEQAASRPLPELGSFKIDLIDLTDFGVKYRYPGSWATAQNAQRALTAMKALRAILRRALGLKR